MLFPANYLSEQDWSQLLAPDASLFRIMMVVVQRFKSLGIKSLHEQTVRWAVALLVCLWSDKIGKLPGYNMIFELVKDLKKAFETAPGDVSRASLPFILKFPEHTADLPEGFVEKAYGSDPPVVKTLEKLAHVALHHVPLRSNSKLLAGCTSQTGSTAASGSATQPMAEIIRQAILQAQSQHQQQHPHIQMLQPGLGNQAYQANQQHQQHQQQYQHIQMLQPALGNQTYQANSDSLESSNSPPNNSPQNNSPPSAAAVTFKPHSRLSNLALDDSPAQLAGFAQLAGSGLSASMLDLGQLPGSAQPAGSGLSASGLNMDQPADLSRVNSEDYEMAAFRAACAGNFKKETAGRGRGKGRGRGRGKHVQPSAALPTQPKASPKASSSAIQKRPAANIQPQAPAEPFGCPKCRYSLCGCTQCKSPSYRGRSVRSAIPIKKKTK